MKYYITLDGGEFIVEAETPKDAIVALWERRADTCRNLDDILPNYWIHAGVAELGGNYEAFPAYWSLTEGAQHVVYHLLKSYFSGDTWNHCCEILLSVHPSQEA